MWTLLCRRAWPLLALPIGCGGGDFSSRPGADGGAGPSGSGSPSTGTGASADEAASSGVMNSGPGSGGGGGDRPDPCASVVCQPNEYCPSGTGTCVKCSDLSKLDFGPPEKLDALNGAATDQRFPRGTH